MTALPPWLADAMERKTGLRPGGRWARRARCRTCEASVLRGLDFDWCAILVSVDPLPLTKAEEVEVRAGGRKTYALRRRGMKNLELTARDRWQVAGRIPVFQDFLIVAEHACGGKP